MTTNAMFNLTAYADRLVEQRRKLQLAGKIRSAVDAHSVKTDLQLALDASDALTYSLDQESSSPPLFREAGEIALLSHIVVLYARATKSASSARKHYDPRSSFTGDELKAHYELCDLRDKAIAHFGKGGSYVGNWVVELALLHTFDGVTKAAVTTRRQIVDRPLLARAKNQIERTLTIINPIVQKRLVVLVEALDAEDVVDPEVYREICEFPFNPDVFFGGPKQVEAMQKGWLEGEARGTFGHR